MYKCQLSLPSSSCIYVCFQTGQGSGSLLSLSDAVSQAARTAGVKPITSAEQLQDDLETQELKEAYAEQVTENIPILIVSTSHLQCTRHFWYAKLLF